MSCFKHGEIATVRIDVEAIRSLKDEVDSDLYTSGSGTLVRALLADGLVDELHLFVYPLTRGPGPRLFPENAAPGNLSLVAAQARSRPVVTPGGRRRLPSGDCAAPAILLSMPLKIHEWTGKRPYQ